MVGGSVVVGAVVVVVAAGGVDDVVEPVANGGVSVGMTSAPIATSAAAQIAQNHQLATKRWFERGCGRGRCVGGRAGGSGGGGSASMARVPPTVDALDVVGRTPELAGGDGDSKGRCG